VITQMISAGRSNGERGSRPPSIAASITTTAAVTTAAAISPTAAAIGRPNACSAKPATAHMLTAA
jgi:hypothetical protein